jgi:hypothetical protein
MPRKQVQEIEKINCVISDTQLRERRSLRNKVMLALFTYSCAVIYYMITHP